jgi:heptosyltransferase-2
MAGRILVIRGGAVGDFILTLPALALLREAFPDAHIELLGYRHIVEIAVNRWYAQESRHIEYAAMAGFFNPKAELDPALCTYFSEFQQVISYLFDPDEYFAGNLRRAGVRNLLTGNPKIGDHAHAATQLAEPLQQLALYLDSPAAHIFPHEEDRTAATAFLSSKERSIALHPGSGSPRKNWPIDRWRMLAARLIDAGRPVLIVGGESDTRQLDELRTVLPRESAQFAVGLPLPVLGAVLADCRAYVGHDSGISHLAAAAGAPCVLLFGPTDPSVWAPANRGVNVIRPESGALADISVEDVAARVLDL